MGLLTSAEREGESLVKVSLSPVVLCWVGDILVEDIGDLLLTLFALIALVDDVIVVFSEVPFAIGEVLGRILDFAFATCICFL